MSMVARDVLEEFTARKEAEIVPIRGPTMNSLASASFMLGLTALRLCWIPGVNCALALLAIAFGLAGRWQIRHSPTPQTGLSECTGGCILGSIVLGLTGFVLALYWYLVR
ncbi:MAG: hypothetical protein QN189_02005 [Armatimonadota bacterium]|nr:hypothetical protein [Armatimonadota bacterium]